MNSASTKKRASSAQRASSDAVMPLSRWQMASYTKSASATDASRVSTRCSSASGCSARISSRTSAAAS